MTKMRASFTTNAPNEMEGRFFMGLWRGMHLPPPPILALAVALMMAGCATHPDKIEAEYRGNPYGNASCATLEAEHYSTNRKMIRSVNSQSDLRATQFLLNYLSPILFPAGIIALAWRGDDEGIAVAKGKVREIERTMEMKRCPL